MKKRRIRTLMKQFFQAIRNLFLLFTGELTLSELEKLFRSEARGMYEFFARNMPPPNPALARWKQLIRFGQHIMKAFLLRLTPARRLLYGVALLIFLLIFTNPTFRIGDAVFGTDSGLSVFLLFSILTFLLALELSDKLITRDELSVARDIQISLLPGRINPFAGYETSAFSEVARNVGGDYYDVLDLNDGSKLLVVGDVSGKGISAALYMVKVQTTLRLLVREATDVHELMAKLNHYLYGEMKRNYFLTISFLKLHTDGSIELCRAGQTPALLANRRTDDVLRLQPKGTAIGLSPSFARENVLAGHFDHSRPDYEPLFFGETIEVDRRTLNSGETILLFTDGVVEMLNRRGEEYGETRLVSFLNDHSHRRAEEIKNELAGTLERFREGAELRDDVTFVVLQRV